MNLYTTSIKDIFFFTPIIISVIGILLLFLIDIFIPKNKYSLILQKSILLLNCVFVGFFFFTKTKITDPQTLFGGFFIYDIYTEVGYIFLTICCFFSIFFSYSFLKTNYEYFYIFFTLLAASLLLSASSHFISLFISLELLSVCSYILACFSNNKESMESAFKYLLYGVLASGVMLYGMSILYAMTGSMHFMDYQFISSLSTQNYESILFFTLLFLLGIFFKIGIFPFHIWMPNIFQNSSLPFIALLSTIPKIACFLVLFRICSVFLAVPYFSSILLFMGIIAITAANLLALFQTNIRKMFAYSSISHSGFLFLLLSSVNTFSFHTFCYYSIALICMNFLAFLLLDKIELFDKKTFKSISGIGEKNILLSFLFIIVLISLTGLPPTAGFFAKLYIFLFLWERYVSGDVFSLVIFFAAILNTVLSLFYYIKIPYYLFFKKTELFVEKIPLFFAKDYILYILTILLIVLFFIPELI